MSPNSHEFKIIARIRTDFPTKFGIPRQSGLCDNLTADIVFEKEFRNPDSLRGLEGFSHLWLIWEFSENLRNGFSPTVRPPRLGGNERVGVFASRSPFRPNPIGLSCVRLTGIERTEEYGTVLHVSGADMMDGTPIFDIKPYLPYTDSRPDAAGGYSERFTSYRLKVDFPQELINRISPSKLDSLVEVLSNDPRPSYQNDPFRIYGFPYAGCEVRFTVGDGILKVVSVENAARGAVIAGGLSDEAKKILGEHSVDVFEPEPSVFLPQAVSLHADMVCHVLPDGCTVLAAGQEQLARELTQAGYKVCGEKAGITAVYPGDCALNAAPVGKNLLCRTESLSPVLMKYYTDNAYNIIDVKQGYTKCGTAVVSHEAIMTENREIHEKAALAGIDSLLLSAGQVALPGYEYGFIGGACGLIKNNLLAFNGDISGHPQFSGIKEFLHRHGVEFVCLTDGELTDCGGILRIR